MVHSRLPSMVALNCFRTAARLGSFTQAGAALNLTQSAVSRQVARLEALLGIPLFVRQGPNLKLTPRGEAYAAAIGPALAAIESATRRYRSELDDGVISLATLPSLGMSWLAPRLTALTRYAPELVVNLSARSDEFDFAAEDYDAAIHFGRPEWPGARCDYLFGELARPVIAPSLLHELQGAEVRERGPLLTLTNRPGAWEPWLDGVHKPRAASARFEHFAMLVQAVVAGAGAAVLPEYLIRDELAHGQLVPLPGTEPRPTDGAYYLVYPPEKLEKSAFRKFRRWLLTEAAAESAED